jgi:hypothetical protein
MEHIPHVESFQSEIHRVLKPGGVVVHLMPTAAWRWWTFLGYYVTLSRVIRARVLGRRDATALPQAESIGGEKNPVEPCGRRVSPIYRALRALLPRPHGVRGNVITEIYYFNRWRWLSLFRRTGWRVQCCTPARLLYTGHSLIGDALSMRTRERLSYPLGSACLIYVLRCEPRR